MTLPILGLVLFSVTLSGLAQVSFKLGVSSPQVREAMGSMPVAQVLLAMASSPGVLAGLAMYGLGTLVWLHVLARTELSLAYPFVGLSFVITAACGALLFNEAPTPARLAGTALVLIGVVLIGRA